MTARARGPELYARELERALSRIRERPVVLSPRDWEMVLDWHAREIPLGVILETLEEAGARARKRGSAGPRSLSYLASAVEEAWNLIPVSIEEMSLARTVRNGERCSLEARLRSQDDQGFVWDARAADDSGTPIMQILSMRMNRFDP